MMRRWIGSAGLLALLVALLALAGCGGSGSSSPKCPNGAGTAGPQVCSQDSMTPPHDWGPQQQGILLVPPSAGALVSPEGITGSNGNLPLSELCPALGGVSGPYPGEGRLLCGGAVQSWNSMEAAWHARTGTYGYATGPASMYRPFSEQVRLRNYWCSLGNCSNAAVPGTSNHGWALAVDSDANAQQMVLTIGPQFHWNIRGGCSDAPWEAWHARYCGGWTGGGPSGNPGPPPFHVLRLGDGGPRVRALNCRYLHLGRVRGAAGHGHYATHGTRHYGPGMKLATIKFQRDSKIAHDGVYGQQTHKHMTARWRHYLHHHHDPQCGQIGRG